MGNYVGLCAVGAVVAAIGGMAGAPRATAVSPPIRHVVIIYLENHSFDNVLGYWCDVHRGRCPDGGMPAAVRLSDGAVVKPTVDPDTIPNINHDGRSQVIAMDNGKMDGWDKIPKLANQTGCGAQWSYVCVSGYKPSQEPNFAGLADEFAISDMTFSMSDSPSWEGHIYAVAASTDGFWGSIPAARPVRKALEAGAVTAAKLSPGFPLAAVGSKNRAACRTSPWAWPTAGRSSPRGSSTYRPSWTG